MILSSDHFLTVSAVSLSHYLYNHITAYTGFLFIRSRISFSSWQSWTLLCLLPPQDRVELLPGKGCPNLPEYLGRSTIPRLCIWSPGLAAYYLSCSLKMLSLQWPSLPAPSPNLSAQSLLGSLHSPRLAFFQDSEAAAVILERPLPGGDIASRLPWCSDLI